MPYVADGTTSCVTEVSFVGTPLPSIPPIATELATPDPEDPAGWTYCYDSGYYGAIFDPEWYSHFSDSVIGAMANDSNCEQEYGAWAPAVVVQQASFLLETTTAFVAGSKQDMPDALPTSVDKSPAPSALVDPFETSTSPKTIAKPNPSNLPPATAPTKPENTEEDKPPSRSTLLSPDPTALSDKEDRPDTQGTTIGTLVVPVVLSSTSIADKEASTHLSQESSHGQSLESTPPPAGQFDALTSLINIAAQQSSGVTASESNGHLSPSKDDGPPDVRPQDHSDTETTTVVIDGEDGTHSTQTVVSVIHLEGALTSSFSVTESSVDPTTIVHSMGNLEPFLTLGSATATLASASVYLVGTQTLTPGGPAVTLSGTFVSIVPHATAVVVGSSPSGLTTSSAIGDYIWAGIAGLISDLNDSGRPASESTEGASNDDIGDDGATLPQSSITTTSNATDGSILAEATSREEPITTTRSAGATSNSAAASITSGANIQEPTSPDTAGSSVSELSSSSTSTIAVSRSNRVDPYFVLVGLAMAFVCSLLVIM